MRQAGQVEPGTAGTTHQPQEDLVEYRTAEDFSGAWLKTRALAMGPLRPQLPQRPMAAVTSRRKTLCIGPASAFAATSRPGASK